MRAWKPYQLLYMCANTAATEEGWNTLITIQALGVSEGLVKAKAFVLREPDLSVTKQKVEDIAAEQARVDEAVQTAKAQIQSIIEEAGETLGDKAELFEAHVGR